MSTEFDYSLNGHTGRRYMIHLKNKDEVCLHALTILQAELLPCYIYAEFSKEDTQLVFDLGSCIPLSDLKGKDLIEVRRNARKLLSDFLGGLLYSLHYAMDLNAILFQKENLFYDRKKKKLVCLYLPLVSRLYGKTALLSGCDEHGLDELLAIPYEKKWISSSAMEKLYTYFRQDDEKSAASYVRDELWERSRPIPLPLRGMLFLWSVFFLLYLFCSVFIERSFAGTIWAAGPGFLFFVCTMSLITVLLMHMDQNKHERRITEEEKEKRRKSRNARLLFPGCSLPGNPPAPLSLSSAPVELVGIRSGNLIPTRFTVWTHRLIVGGDSDMCDYTIDHPSVALIHASFGYDEQGFYLEALQNGKGTYRNRQHLASHEKAYLQDGDIVGIGDLEFVTKFVHPQSKKEDRKEPVSGS